MTAARREDRADARSLAGARERRALRTRPSSRDDMAIGRREGDRRSARSPLFVQAEFLVASPIFIRGSRRKKRKMTEAFSHASVIFASYPMQKCVGLLSLHGMVHLHDSNYTRFWIGLPILHVFFIPSAFQ